MYTAYTHLQARIAISSEAQRKDSIAIVAWPSHCWGVFVEHPRAVFFADSKKTAARSAARFSPTLCAPSFRQLLWKFRSCIMQGRVTRSGQVTRPYKNFTIAPQLQCLRENYETFRIWLIRSSVPTKSISQIFISVTLGQVIFVTSPSWVNWQKLNSLFYASTWAYMNGIALCKVFSDTSSELFRCWPL